MRRASTSTRLGAAARPSPSTRPRREYRLRRLLALADTLAVTVALAFSAQFIGGGPTGQAQFVWALITLPAWIVLFKLYGLYDRDGKRVSHSTVDDVPWIFHALVVGGLGLWLFSKAAPVHRLFFSEGVAFFIAAFVGMFLARASIRTVARISIPPERVVFVGGSPMTRLLVRKIVMHPEYGLEPIGYVDTEAAKAENLDREIPYLGSVGELEVVCIQEGADRIVIAAPSIEEDVLADLVRLATSLDVRISILPHLVEVLGPSVEIDDVEGITVLGINPSTLTRSSRFLKRTMDIVIGSACLLLALPLMAAIALVLKLTSPGPVIYSQERLGRAGRYFRIHKFRTMIVDADDRARELQSSSAHPAWLLLERDPRITPLGRLLRRASLDELPQLWNVLKGDMSLVGPRPMTHAIDEQISGWGRRRLDLTPGLTGLWQVLGRTSIPFEEMIKLDYLYVTNWSLWQDVRLLIRTLPAVLRRNGAN